MLRIFCTMFFFDSGTKYLIPPLPLPGDLLPCCLSWEESGKRCVYWFPALLAALKVGLAPNRSFCTLVSNLLTAYNLFGLDSTDFTDLTLLPAPQALLSGRTGR